MNPLISRLFFLSCFLFATSLPLSVNAVVKDKLIFGGDSSGAPFEWHEQGEEKGFTIDLEDKLAKVGGIEAVHKLGKWSEMTKALESGEIDVLPMYISEERQNRFLFSSPFYFVQHAIYTYTPNNDLITLDMLSNQKVAIEESYFAHEELIKNHPDVKFILRTSTLAVLEALEKNEAKYAILAIPAASYLIDKNNLNISALSSPIWPRGYGFAVRKDRPELAEWIERNLNLVLTSESYHNVYQKWRSQLEHDRLSPADIFKKSLLIIFPLFLMIVFGYMWSVSLKRQVKRKTHEVHTQLKLKEIAEAKLKHRSRHDELTGLPHYFHAIRLGNQIFQSNKKTQEPKEVIVFKLDESELRTRTFGHEMEQKFIKAFAERLKLSGFDVSSYIGRGFFAIISSQNRFRETIDKLNAKIYVNKIPFHPQVLCGIATWPGDGTDAEELGRKAEAALAFCSDNKQGWYSYYSESMEPDKYDLQILSEFRHSGTANMFVMLQPQVDLKTGRVTGAEALIRWTSKELGVVPPGKFISLLETSGLVSEVTRFVITEVIKISARLSKTIALCPISINVSAQDFKQVNLYSFCLESIEKHNGQADNIKLELTETSIAENPDQVKTTLKELSDIGIHTSIDDFGTGYSSLSYLSNYPIKEIKIDRTFIHDLASNKRHKSIVRSTIAMAHALGISVVAEGAEDHETMEILRVEGCDTLQGYVISKPLTEHDFLAFIQKNNSEQSSATNF